MTDEKLHDAAGVLAAGGYDLWDVFEERSRTQTITLENNRIDRVINGVDYGIGLRGLKDGRTFYGYTNIASEAAKTASALGSGAVKPAAPPSFRILSPESVHDASVNPAGISAEEKIALLKEMNEAARSVSPHIKQVTVTYLEKEQDVFMLSDLLKSAREKRIYTSFVIQVTASKNGRIESSHSVVSGRKGYEIINRESLRMKVLSTAGLASRLLGVDKKINGVMTAVISSSAGGTMIHEAVGHSLEADLIQKDLSEYKGRKGAQIAASVLTVIDDATIPNSRGSFSFDDEGVPSRRKILVKNGRLEEFMQSRETAMKTGEPLTGNGRRESYRFKPIPRMTNTMIAQGSGKPDDLIKDTNNGILVKRMGGGQVNTVTGEFIFEVREGYLIENGEITEPLRDATLMGKSSEVLNTIDAVCDDLGFDVGTCGKDGQGVPVADAQPTIRIPSILVGSK